MAYRYTVYHSPIGVIGILIGKKGLLAASLHGKFQDFQRKHRKYLEETWEEVDPLKHALLGRIIRSLHAYFDGHQPLPLNIPLDPAGTDFQLRVWEALRAIPHGETSSYGEIARAVGSPEAARAVGAACGANPILLFIPCHRVIAAAGRLGGFTGGLEVKKWLLQHEKSG